MLKSEGHARRRLRTAWLGLAACVSSVLKMLTIRGIVFVVIILVLVASMLKGLPGRWARASHPWDPHVHLYSINSGFQERFCVYIENSPMDLATAYDRVHNTLRVHNVPEDWSWIDPYFRIGFIGNGGISCNADPNGPAIEVKYRVGDYGCPTYSDARSSCAVPLNPYFDDISGHTEHRFFRVELWTPHVNGAVELYHHAINHETGHVLGLLDGDGTCPDSVMHSIRYGCSVDREWPSQSDRDSVVSLLPPVNRGGGGGGKGIGW